MIRQFYIYLLPKVRIFVPKILGNKFLHKQVNT